MWKCDDDDDDDDQKSANSSDKYGDWINYINLSS